ncbi:MAG: DNA-binding response regulator [Proteobacteria bacterium]|nr:DNA-binding response regulator [Pseudomonadota bacterium]
MNRILVVGDDKRLRKDLSNRLAEMGFQTRFVLPGEQAASALWQNHPDLILFQYNGNSQGLRAFSRELKGDEETRSIPLVAVVQETEGREFDLWDVIDDFIITPCRSEELELRIRHVQRKKGLNFSGENLQIGNLAIDFAAYEVAVRGVPVALTFKEYELLKFLVTHPNRVFNRNALLQRVWGYDAYVGTRTVDIHIRRLRSKLGNAGSGIQTVRNVGYKFNLESAATRLKS